MKSPVAYIRYIHNGYGRWLDAELGGIHRNGTKVHLWDWNGGNNQVLVVHVVGQRPVVHSERA